jgi:carbamoyltransferase
VLADPRDPVTRLRLNQRLKKRDWFMPYAPSVLADHGADYFADFRPSPYMHLAFRVRPEMHSRIPAAVHVDGTCRAHVLESGVHDRFHAVVSAFHRQTGIAMVLNTSFNRHGMPMVTTPRQAIHLLLQGCIDVLAIEGHIVTAPRPRVTGSLTDDATALREMEAARIHR